MRAVSGPALAQLNAERMRVALLVEFQFSLPVYLNTANVDITYGGNKYLGIGTLGAINEVDDSPGEYKNLTLSLSGVSLDVISIALQENIRNKRLVVREAIIDQASFAVLDAPVIWSGTMDQMPVSQDHQNQTATVSLSAEHRGITFARAKPLNYTQEDQGRVDPTDTSLRFIQSQSTRQDIWPAAGYWKQ